MKLNHTTGALVDGKLRTINEFSDTDRKLDFRCKKCKEPLILRLRKTRNQSHFAHKPDSNCTGAQESAYHLMAKEVLKESRTIYTPNLSFEDGNEGYNLAFKSKMKDSDCLYGWVENKIDLEIVKHIQLDNKANNLKSSILGIIIPLQPKSIKSKKIEFERIEIEDEFNNEEEKKQKSVFYKKYGFIPDAVGYVKDKQGVEKEVIIEFYYSHKVDEIKLNKIKEQNLPCIEIDISKIELDREVFKKYLANKDCKSFFLTNPKADEIKSNFLKVIEDSVLTEVNKFKTTLHEKEVLLQKIKEDGYEKIPFGVFSKLDSFCPRSIEKKSKYKNTNFYRDKNIKELVDGVYSWSGQYSMDYYERYATGVTLYNSKTNESKHIKMYKHLKIFLSDYYTKILSTKGCLDCKFYKEMDFQNKFCGSPEVKPFVDPFESRKKLIDAESKGSKLLNNLSEGRSPLQNNSISKELTSKPKLDKYNIENREDFFK